MAQYVKLPGGVILHLADGSAEFFAYGAEVDPEQLADYQQKSLGNFTDDKDRGRSQANEVGVNAEAHRAAALAEGGQPNSTSDPVPGNYAELSEEDAARLVSTLESHPAVQARILLHEQVRHGGRQMVLDAGTDRARELLEELQGIDLEQRDNVHLVQTQGSQPDRERDVEKQVRDHEAQQAKAQKPARGKTPAPNEG